MEYSRSLRYLPRHQVGFAGQGLCKNKKIMGTRSRLRPHILCAQSSMGVILTERFGVQQTAVLPQRIQSSFTIKS